MGVDATAARSCFLMLKIVLRTSGVDVAFSSLSPKVQALLRSHGVITDDDPVFNRCGLRCVGAYGSIVFCVGYVW